MKVYYIDKLEKNLTLKDKLIENGLENIEVKDTYNFRATKNDFVVLSEYDEKDSENESLKKYNNLIFITKEKDEDIIWKIANSYKTIDIISYNCNKDYIAQRISKIINQKGVHVTFEFKNVTYRNI